MLRFITTSTQQSCSTHAETTLHARSLSPRFTKTVAALLTALALSAASGCALWPEEETRAPTVPEWVGQQRVGEVRR
jgi:hypothetical protein